jgi:hypothetical protein
MKNFWKSVFCEPDGNGSYSRISGAAMVLAVIGWGTYLVIHNHTMPSLGEATALTSAPYVANKISGFLKKDSPAPPAA